MRKLSLLALLALVVTPILVGCSGGDTPPADDGKAKPSAEDKMMKKADGDE